MKKAKFMMFHNQNKTTDAVVYVTILERPIEIVPNLNFIGEILNDNYKFNNHVDSVCNQISKSIGIFCKLKHHLPTYILKTFYNMLILSYFT